MFVVDTNVLVYAVDVTSPFNARCRHVLDDARAQPGAWYLTWGICYEFLRVVTHRRVFRSPLTPREAWGFLNHLFAAPSLTLLVATDRHAGVLSEVLDLVPHISGSFWHDATTAVLMREHGISRIYTRDTGFHRFPFIEPIDPCG